MTDWKTLARALDPPVPDEAADSAAAILEPLKKIAEPLIEALPIDTLPWDRP